MFTLNNLYKIELKIYPNGPYIKNISVVSFSLFKIWYGIYASLEKSISMFPVLP